MIRPITIIAALNGYICTVGCQTVVFETAEELVRNLKAYLKNPHQTEREWLTGALNANHLGGVPQMPPPPPHPGREADWGRVRAAVAEGTYRENQGGGAALGGQVRTADESTLGYTRQGNPAPASEAWPDPRNNRILR